MAGRPINPTTPDWHPGYKLSTSATRSPDKAQRNPGPPATAPRL